MPVEESLPQEKIKNVSHRCYGVFLDGKKLVAVDMNKSLMDNERTKHALANPKKVVTVSELDCVMVQEDTDDGS